MRLLVRSLWLLLAGVGFFALAGLVAVWAPDKPMEDLRQRWAPVPSQFLALDGMLVHVRDEGPREDPLPLVLLHGTSDSLHTWDGWADAVKSRRRVIRFDLPGFGLTGPNRDDDYSIGAYVRFVGAMLDRLGVAQVVLGGSSLGGHIAWETASAMPQRVRRLVLVDAGGYGQPPMEVPLAFRVARVPGLRLGLEYVLPRGLVQASVRSVYGDPSKVTPELVDRYYDMALRAGNRRALVLLMNMGLTDESARIRMLTLPTLILWGGRDRLIPLQSGHWFARDLVQSRLVVFEDLGHLPHQEDPQRSVAELLLFLGAASAN